MPSIVDPALGGGAVIIATIYLGGAALSMLWMGFIDPSCRADTPTARGLAALMWPLLLLAEVGAFARRYLPWWGPRGGIRHDHSDWF